MKYSEVTHALPFSLQWARMCCQLVIILSTNTHFALVNWHYQRCSGVATTVNSTSLSFVYPFILCLVSSSLFSSSVVYFSYFLASIYFKFRLAYLSPAYHVVFFLHILSRSSDVFPYSHTLHFSLHSLFL